jgi:hypothetical protein
MGHTHTLTRHRDVQNWITDRKGLPALRRVTDPTSGAIRPRLAIRFDRPRIPVAPTVDDGIMPVSWSAWLAEFDRQSLALKVDDQHQFEFVERKSMQ